MADALAMLRELIEAQDALKVEQRDLWSANRRQRVNDALTRAWKAEAAARRVIAGVPACDGKGLGMGDADGS